MGALFSGRRARNYQHVLFCNHYSDILKPYYHHHVVTIELYNGVVFTTKLNLADPKFLSATIMLGLELKPSSDAFLSSRRLLE